MREVLRMTADAAARAATRPLRRALRALETSDPDGSQFRLALTTMFTLIVVAIVLFTGASVAGLPATAVTPGLILAMIASTAVAETRPGPRAITILLLVPTAFAAISAAAFLRGFPLVSDAVFVGVAAGAVYLRALGPRGSAVGVLAFMSYFVAVFTRAAPAELPVVAAALLVSAGLTIIIRLLFGRRRPAHDLQRMLRALGDRAHRVADALQEGVTDGGLDNRLERTIRSRLAASSSTASSVEEVLERATDTVVPGISEDELGARVFDFQLSVEHLVESVRWLLSPANGSPATPADRAVLAEDLNEFAAVVRGPVQLDRAGAAGGHYPERQSPMHTDDERLIRLERILAIGTEAWHRVASRGPDPLEDAPASEEESDEVSSLDRGGESRRASMASETIRPHQHTLSREAAQVAVAAALAIAAGTAISSSYWFWAVIAAFVIYIGTSSRGEILTKGWLRIVGTLGGVIVGVVVATLVGGNTILAIGLIAACLFLSVYVTPLSSAFQIFFITTMLALLYGLLGVFTIGLLVTRLSETAVGAAIGVGVAYLVLPTGTRDVARDHARDFLLSLASALTTASDRLGADRTDSAPSAERVTVPHSTSVLLTSGRDLRNAFDELGTAVRPLTEGVAGVSDRSGSRRTLQLVGACERHGRALLRLADSSPGIIESKAVGHLLSQASDAVRANVDSMSGAIGGQYRDVTMTSADSVLDIFEDHIDALDSADRKILILASRNLRAIDRAICTRAGELGSSIRPGEAT